MASTPSLLIVTCMLVGACSSALFNVATAEGKDFQNEFVKEHNKYRAQVGVPPLYWSDDCAEYAQNYADKRKDCKPEHSHGPYGENIVMASGDLTPAQAVKYWFDEKADYDHETNQCTGGKECHHYTQLVWKDSTDVGCGKSKCSNGWTFIVCSYYPPGNVVDEEAY